MLIQDYFHVKFRFDHQSYYRSSFLYHLKSYTHHSFLFPNIRYDLFIGFDEDIEVEVMSDAVVTLCDVVPGLICRAGKDVAELFGVVTGF